MDPFDTDLFRSAGHRLVDELADYLGKAQAGDMPVLPTVAPDKLLRELSEDFPTHASDNLLQLLLDICQRSNHLHHPGYVGHQVATVLPQAALCELTNALLNNGMAVYEMGQVQTIMERHVVAFLAKQLHLGAQADGVLTHGGSVGNLTALLAARQAKADHDVWQEGQHKRFAVLVSEQAHYCVSRAVQVMGWGAGGAVRVATDHKFRLDPTALPGALKRAQDRGYKVLGVVASSCSTATGSFDPLSPIADFCDEHGLWMHVDGAHGASLALSAQHRHLLEGIERADSVVWDLHKMMCLPALATAVLFRDDQHSYEAFAQKASYLFEDVDPEREWYQLGRRTLECTKRGIGMTAYVMLQSCGTRAFAQNIESMIGLTQRLAELLDAADDFETAHSPQANILCFRHIHAGDLPLNAHQSAIRRRVLARGHFYLVQVRLGNTTWLRVSMMNPRTTESELTGLLDEIRTVAATPE